MEFIPLFTETKNLSSYLFLPFKLKMKTNKTSMMIKSPWIVLVRPLKVFLFIYFFFEEY